jgi:GxxExxY protein
MAQGDLVHADITGSVIGAFYEVYNALGYGFLESVYLAALERELIARGHRVGREVYVRVFYKGEAIAHQRVDMIVDEKVIVESKASERLPPTTEEQVLNYLCATTLKVALILHFGPKAEFRRLVAESIRADRKSAKIVGNPRNPIKQP